MILLISYAFIRIHNILQHKKELISPVDSLEINKEQNSFCGQR